MFSSNNISFGKCQKADKKKSKEDDQTLEELNYDLGLPYKPPARLIRAKYKELLDQSDCWKLFVQL